MQTLDMPRPSPLLVQSSGGPSSGQSANNPVAGETASRFGPRHCGQSSVAAGDADSGSSLTSLGLVAAGDCVNVNACCFDLVTA
jgi:hypothetical protein